MLLWFGLCFFTLPSATRADGFRLTEQSAASMGMGSAVSASTQAPDAAWYNPAALAFMPGVQASLNANTYLGSSSFKARVSGTETDAKPLTQVIPGAFVTARVHERIAIGLSVNVPFGLGIEWPRDWPGRNYAIESSVTVLNINPVVSLKLLSNLSIASGLQLMRGVVDMTNGLPTGPGDSVRLAGAAWGVGANVALLYRAIPDRVHFAATYRSRVRLGFSGRAHFSIAEPVFTAQLFDQSGDASFTLPDIITLGVMYKPRPDLRIGFDASAVLWSTYKEVPIDFANPGTPDTGLRPNYHSMVSFHLGAEWSTPVDGLKARLGVELDPSPAPETGLSPSLPDSFNIGSCLGIGYHTAQLGADLGYVLAVFLPAKARMASDLSTPPQSPEGTYHTLIHILGVSVTGRVGASKSSM